MSQMTYNRKKEFIYGIKRTSRVCKDVFARLFCATRAMFILSTESYSVRETIKQEKRNGTLVNACGPRAAKSAIVLDNGAVASSPVKPETLVNRINQAQNLQKVDKNFDTTEEDEDDIDDIPFDDIVNEELEDEDE